MRKRPVIGLAAAIVAVAVSVGSSALAPLVADPGQPQVEGVGVQAVREIRQDFESQTSGQFPMGWTSTSSRPVLPATVAAPGAFGSGRSLLLQPSSPSLHQGASVWHPLPATGAALQIELSFAFGGGPQRIARLWTADETSFAPTQLNLAIMDGGLGQFHPLFHQWLRIGGVLTESMDPSQPVWYRMRIVIAPDGNSLGFWLSEAGRRDLPERPIAVLPAYRTGLELARLHVAVERGGQPSYLRLDDVTFRSDESVIAPPLADPGPEFHHLWSGPPIPENQDQIPWLDAVTHVIIHAPRDGQYTFLHGAAIVSHEGRLYANWANSPVDENSPDETLQGSASMDGGLTWAPRQVIARGTEGELNFSHAAYLSLDGQLWTFVARFSGVSEQPDVKFPGLRVEALVLDEKADRWTSRGIVAHGMWPMAAPIRLENGSWITAGQGTSGEPGVLISRGGDLTCWRTVRIPVSPEMPQGFGETTLLPIAGGRELLALVRPGRGPVAWASVSRDAGGTWTPTRRTNYPIGIAKMYAGRLSTGQPYVIANFPALGRPDRDTLVIAFGRPGEDTVSRIRQIRSGAPRPVYPGFAKVAQFSYPYAHEHDGKLYVVYSVGKEECGLSIIPISSLIPE